MSACSWFVLAADAAILGLVLAPRRDRLFLSLLLIATACAVLNELLYCREMAAKRWELGPIADAQAQMLDLGWLQHSDVKPGHLAITPRGKRVLAAWETGR